MIAGIYQILNIVTGFSYVGQATNLSRRLSEHTRKLKSDKHKNNNLQRSWNKHGEKNFQFNVLEEVDVTIPELLKEYKTQLTAREEVWIDEFRPKVYNQRIAADSNAGIKYGPQTAEHIAKRVATCTGRKQSAEHKANNAAAQKGKNHSAETKAKMSTDRKGKKKAPRSAEHIANHAAAKKHHSDEFILNLFAELKAGLSRKEIAEKYKLKYSTVRNILSGHAYAHIYCQVHGLVK